MWLEVNVELHEFGDVVMIDKPKSGENKNKSTEKLKRRIHNYTGVEICLQTLTKDLYQLIWLFLKKDLVRLSEWAGAFLMSAQRSRIFRRP